MREDTTRKAEMPEGIEDLLTETIRRGARDLLRIAVEAEVDVFLEKYGHLEGAESKRRFVRNGYLPERGIQTGVGEVRVTVPRIRDRASIKNDIQFASSIIPKYLRRSVKMQEFLPLLYLKGISTGDFRDALVPLMGDTAKGLSANVICRLKERWEEEYQQWNQRCLSRDNYVYWWVDGIYLQARMEEAKDCVLVIVGVTDTGYKEIIAIEDGYRESKESWLDLLRMLKHRGLKNGPKLAAGDGALGFWGAVTEIYPETKHQRCWMHKTVNILNYLPKTLHAQAKTDIQQIWMSDTKEKAYKAYDKFVCRYQAKYPKAVECLKKSKEELLTFYSFPAEHWKSLRTTNPIESIFATVRHRTRKSKGCYSRTTIMTMVFKLCESAEKRLRRIHGFKKLEDVAKGAKFINGVKADNTVKFKQKSAS